MKPCTLAKRHRWTFLKNVVTSNQNGRTVSFHSRGLYRCECGARKYGTQDMNEILREGEPQ